MSTEYIFMEDWDLQAVVRGSGACGDSCVDITGNPPSGVRQESLLWSNSSEIFEAAAREVSDDLRELYKPFYPVFHPLSSQTLLASSISLHKEPQNGQQTLQPALPSRSSGMASSDEDGVQAAKSKRSRKNQQKRVVQQVTADGLSSDMWAWRKYGQKPIKGSPYPRSYYRCSSTKGCLARKQVERSRSDPEIFIVTYTAEHNHEQPTRRNSLAGSTRIKSSTPKAPAASDTLLSRDSQTILSPRTSSSVTSIEGDLPKQESLKQEEEEQILLADLQGYDIAMPDMMMSNELFPSLEDLDGMFSAENFFNGINCFSD